MKYIFILCSLALFSCSNQPTTGSSTEAPSTTSDANAPTAAETQPAEKVNMEPQNYFSAMGKDWSVDLKSAINGTFPVQLIRNNGKDTLNSVLSKVMEGNAKPASGKSSVNFTGVVTLADKEETISLGIVPGACSSASGEKTNFTCKISVGKSVLNGCGNYSEE